MKLVTVTLIQNAIKNYLLPAMTIVPKAINNKSNNDIDKENESDTTNSEDEEDESLNSRQRKCEYSTLDESSSKKKYTPVLRWLRNGDKVSILNRLLIIFQTCQF